MTKLEQLLDIAKRLEAATASCNTIDVSIADALGITLDKAYNDNVGEDWYIISGGWPDRLYCWLPYFTNSIDAALGLVGRVLPGWMTCVATQGVILGDHAPTWTWELDQPQDPEVRPYGRSAPTAPLAILKALFAALIQQEESK